MYFQGGKPSGTGVLVRWRKGALAVLWVPPGLEVWLEVWVIAGPAVEMSPFAVGGLACGELLAPVAWAPADGVGYGVGLAVA